MLSKILSLLVAMMPAQVCGTPDLSTWVLFVMHDCPAATEHLCWSGDWPDDSPGTACCNAVNECRIDDDGVCLSGERAACGLLPQDMAIGCATDDYSSVYVTPGTFCQSGYQVICGIGAFNGEAPAVCCEADMSSCLIDDNCSGDMLHVCDVQ